MSPEAIEEMVSQRVAAAIAQYELNRNSIPTGVMGDTGAGGSGTVEPRMEPGLLGDTSRGCSYKAFMACKPRNFNGKEGAVGLICWIEKMESVLNISNTAEDCKVKYATCTFNDEALTWWNSQVRLLTLEVAYQKTWEELKEMLKEEYCPRNEM